MPGAGFLPRQELRLVTGPVTEPVTLNELKARLRVDNDLFDDDLVAMARSARAEIDGANGWLGRAILTQTWDLVLSGFPLGPVTMPLPPLQSIVSVGYQDSAGLLTIHPPLDRRLLLRGDAPSLLEPVDGWPDYDASYGAAVTIRFVCGWTSPQLVPEPIKTWIMARAGAIFASPEAAVVGVNVAPVPFYETMLSSYRVW